MKVSAWQGKTPRLFSLSGRLITNQINKEPLKGAEIEVLDSLSGWASMTNEKGEFTIRDVLWYPKASYSVVITANAYQVRLLQVAGPEDYPEIEIYNLGELEFDRGCRIDETDLPGRNSITYIEFDSENIEYYRELFAELTKGKENDEEKLLAINLFVASRFIPSGFTGRYLSPKQVLEKGTGSRGMLALTLGTIAGAGNYRTRMIDLIDEGLPPAAHMITEVYYGNGWHLYDPTTGVTYRNNYGTVASYKELRLDTNLISAELMSRPLSEVLNSPRNRGANVYQSGFHHYYCFRKD
ncbi:MAG TPA: transglutaminase domain-containing protein [Blastocatellia bacterium]|nr:transglutaminase domain-containing protein [Blastocatellia bacterium]